MSRMIVRVLGNLVLPHSPRVLNSGMRRSRASNVKLASEFSALHFAYVAKDELLLVELFGTAMPRAIFESWR